MFIETGRDEEDSCLPSNVRVKPISTHSPPSPLSTVHHHVVCSPAAIQTYYVLLCARIFRPFAVCSRALQSPPLSTRNRWSREGAHIRRKVSKKERPTHLVILLVVWHSLFGQIFLARICQNIAVKKSLVMGRRKQHYPKRTTDEPDKGEPRSMFNSIKKCFCLWLVIGCLRGITTFRFQINE